MGLNSISRLSKTYSNYARTWKYAIKYRAVAEKYRFEKMIPNHLPLLMDLGKEAFREESITLGTAVTFEECKNGMEWKFSYSIAANCLTNLSDICFDTKTGNAIGFRMNDPHYRDPEKAPFYVPGVNLNMEEAAFFGFMDSVFSKIWDFYPSEEVVIEPALLFIQRAHRTSGLYRVWAEFGADFPTMSKQTGANICATLCTSRKTKVWFEKTGHTLVHTSGPNVLNAKGETVPLPEGPLHLYAADMHKVKTINVKPCWEMMQAVGLMPK